jgi:hypothetical protein
MPTPTSGATSLTAEYIYSNGFRLKFTAGNGARRLVSVTEGSNIKYPIDGEKYDASLKYKKGDQLVSIVSGSGSCYPYPPYPDPIEATMSSTSSTTYVVYEGLDDGTTGLDIINLTPQTTYNIMVLEHNNYCYATSSVLEITTSYSPNRKTMRFECYDNRTRKPIQNAIIAIKDRKGFIADYDYTNEHGVYTSLSLEEGRYEVSIVADNYDTKVLTGIFIQREEPNRDGNYRMFTSAGNTVYGGTLNRNRLENKNEYIIYLDPLDNITRSFTRYSPNDNPSNLTKL